MPSHELRIDLRIYPLLTIQKTVWELTDRYTATITQSGDHEICVLLNDRSATPSGDARAIFSERLLDLTLQDRIAEQTKDIRLALLRAALAEALPSSE